MNICSHLQVVTPDQAQKIYQALKEKGLPVALIEYEGEQHGFRKVYNVILFVIQQEAMRETLRLIYCCAQAENIKFTLEQQMVFFARLVGHFDVADKIIPIKVDNFD